MAWHVLIAIDAEQNADFVTWAERYRTDGVLSIQTASSAPEVITQLNHLTGAVVILASSALPELTQWAKTWVAMGKARSDPTRCVVLADGTPDGVPGPLGSLADIPEFLAWATVVEGTVPPDNPQIVEYDFDQLARLVLSPGNGPETLSSSAPPLEPPTTKSPAPSPSRLGWFRSRKSQQPIANSAQKSVPSVTERPRSPRPSPRQIASQRPPELLVVMGGKGGVGKTFLTASLIGSAAQQWGGVVGLDMDYFKPNLALYFWPETDQGPDLGELFQQWEIAQSSGVTTADAQRRLVEQWLAHIPRLAQGMTIVPGPHRDTAGALLPPMGMPDTLLTWALERREATVIVDTAPTLDEAALQAARLAENGDGFSSSLPRNGTPC